MTHISFTSGEIFDIISALADRCEQYEESDPHLARYFFNMVQQFEMVTEKLNELPGEKRVANLVMTL
jgi:hypothetical protein